MSDKTSAGRNAIESLNDDVVMLNCYYHLRTTIQKGLTNDWYKVVEKQLQHLYLCPSEAHFKIVSALYLKQWADLGIMFAYGKVPKQMFSEYFKKNWLNDWRHWSFGSMDTSTSFTI